MILPQSGVMAAAFVERMAPEDLWTLFQRVVPPAPVRPQDGGHRRRGDREVLAAIIFVATSGCTGTNSGSSQGEPKAATG
jgi:transposase